MSNDTFTITITLPKTHKITSRGVTVDTDMTKFNANILGLLAMHGLDQKAPDKASGAALTVYTDGLEGEALKTAQSAWADMDKGTKAAWTAKNLSHIQRVTIGDIKAGIENMQSGQWTIRAASNGLDPEVAILCKAQVAKNIGAKAWAKMKALAQNESARKLWESLDETKQDAIKVVAATRAKVKAEAKAALAAATVDVELF